MSVIKVFENCPNCGKSLRGGLLNWGAEVSLITGKYKDFINAQNGMDKEAYCDSCYGPLYTPHMERLQKERAEISKELSTIIEHLPIMTCPASESWNYKVLGMVKAQRSSGTGFMAEISMGLSDLLGASSSAANSKIENAINFCENELRQECAVKGGNAIISTNVDFSEIGAGSTNMLMVCMTGTAVKIENLSAFSEEALEYIDRISKLSIKLKNVVNQMMI